MAGSGNDEFYTPYYAIEPLLPYIKDGSTIWCPFDIKESLFVRTLEKEGHTVIHTHISDGIDFFTTEVPECDYIISNPPYSMKTEVLGRLFDIDKPFAMLLGVVGLFESQKRFNMFRDNKFEVMYFNKRVSYMSNYDDFKTENNPPFSSVYITHNMLPKDIMFAEIDKKKVQIP